LAFALPEPHPVLIDIGWNSPARDHRLFGCHLIAAV
jgi:hypothetical protein